MEGGTYRWIDIRWNRNGDGTYLKEYYAFETYRRNGVLAPRTNPVNMFMTVDGSKQNMGVYLAVEDIGKAFIKRNLRCRWHWFWFLFRI